MYSLSTFSQFNPVCTFVRNPVRGIASQLPSIHPPLCNAIYRRWITCFWRWCSVNERLLRASYSKLYRLNAASYTGFTCGCTTCYPVAVSWMQLLNLGTHQPPPLPDCCSQSSSSSALGVMSSVCKTSAKIVTTSLERSTCCPELMNGSYLADYLQRCPQAECNAL